MFNNLGVGSEMVVETMAQPDDIVAFQGQETLNVQDQVKGQPCIRVTIRLSQVGSVPD